VWAFLFGRIRLLLVVVILLPIVASVARRLAALLERRAAGPTVASRGLRAIEGVAVWVRSLLR